MANPLNDFGLKIFLDRYAQKDTTKATLIAGDTVVVCTNQKTRQREVGNVLELIDNPGNKPRVKIKLLDGSEVTQDWDDVDKPTETTPEQTMARTARGIAGQEATDEKRAEWEEKFKWLLDEWRFVPGGRILSAAGTDQALTYFNCYVLPSPKDSRQGIVDTLSSMMEIMSRGGGVGINLSSLRPRHNYVKGVNGRSSGSISWGGLYSFVTGLIEQGGCFAPYARILTDKGNIPVLEIVERMEKGEAFQAWTHKGWRKITDKFRNGRKSVHRLTTDQGYTLDITGEHKVMTMDESGTFGLVKLDKLNAGDSVMILRGSVPNDIPYVTLATDVPKDVQGQDVRLPAELDEDLAYVLGYYVGNGCIAKLHGEQVNNLTFAVPHNRPSTLEKLVDVLGRAFHRPVNQTQGDGAVDRVAVFSRQLVRYFNANGFTKDGALNAAAPEQIFRSRRSVIEAFIGGWFAADGCNRGSKGGFGIDTVSYKGAQDLQKLLQMLGIVSRIATQTREAEGWNTIYRVVVSGSYMCSELAKWLGDYTDKVADLPLPVKNHAYTWPVNFNKTYRPAFTPKFDRIMPPWNGTTSQAAIAHVRDNVELLTEEQAEHFTMLDNCVHDKIVSIEKIGVMDTYDLTVDEVHTMSGDGVYVSNSRRGALMLILNLDHPDVLDFIDAKREAGKITNANISVAIPDAFMDAVRDDGDWNLVFPDTTHEAYDAEWNGDLKAWRAKGYPVVTHKTVRARELWRKIASSAWASAEPGILFIDRVNAMSNSHYFSPLICTNPCGEQPLPAWGICNLGAINLGVHVDDNGKVKWDELKQTVRYAVRFLDNVIDATPYFIDENKKQQQNERRVGLGIMGLAEMLVKCGVRYGSKAGVEFVDELGKFIATEAYIASSDYAAEKGAFPAFDADKLLDSGFMKGMPKSVRSLVKKQGLRNVTLLTVAPTGTTGTMVDTSTGVEPYFSWTYWRKSRLGMNEIEVDIVKDWRKANPEAKDLPDYFVTAMELSPEEHVVMQGALQRWIDSALSKTCNAPNNYTVDDVQKLYELMYKLGCKGGTIYRDGSRDEQVLMTKAEPVAAVAVQAPDIDAEARKLGYVKIEDAAANPDVIAKILASVGVQAQPDLVSRRRKDKVMQSINCKQQTHLGSCYTDVTYDRNNDPLEIFVRSGKAGSDVASLAEGLGRLASTLLTIPSPVPPMERLRDIAGHLEGIGGSDSVGFGRAQIKSMPDAVGKSLLIIADELDTRKGKVTAAEPEEKVDESKPVRKSKKAAADICPSCGGATYIREEGCKHCTSCGHSACG